MRLRTSPRLKPATVIRERVFPRTHRELRAEGEE